MIDKEIVDWLNLKSETDEDMYYVGRIVGTISVLFHKLADTFSVLEEFYVS